VDIVSDEGDHSGPIELTMDVLDRLGDTWVSSQTVVMVVSGFKPSSALSDPGMVSYVTMTSRMEYHVL